MKKYLAIIKIVWQNALAYRLRMLMWFLVEAFPIAGTLYLWFGVYGYGEKLSGFDLRTLLTYYLVSYFIAVNISAHFEEEAVENINAGRITQYFTRPLSYRASLILGELSWKSIYFLTVSIPFIAIVAYFGRNWLIFPGLINFLLLLPFLLLGFIMDSLFSFLVVIAGFFLEQATSFNHLKWMLIELFSGAILPLSAYPQSFRSLAEFLPFHYLRSVPIKIYLNQIDYHTIPGLILQELLWIAGLFILMQILWQAAERKYTAVGN